MKLKTLVLSALLGAILHAAKFAMSGLPNIEPVTLLLLCYALAFGFPCAFSVAAVFILLEGLLYGFNLWWVSYCYIWPLWLGVVFLLRKNRAAPVWAAAAGGFGLLFGALCALPYFAGGPAMALSYWVSGIPFDLLHCVGNFVLTLLLLKPLLRLFERVKRS